MKLHPNNTGFRFLKVSRGREVDGTKVSHLRLSNGVPSHASKYRFHYASAFVQEERAKRKAAQLEGTSYYIISNLITKSNYGDSFLRIR